MKTSLGSSSLPRRDFLAALGGLGAAAVLGSTAPTARAVDAPVAAPAHRKGRLKQAITRGVFRGVKLTDEEMCQEVVKAGAWGIDLVGTEMFPLLKKYSLLPTMIKMPGGSEIKAGINDPKLHAGIDEHTRAQIKAAAEFGAPNVIILAGDRKGFTDEESMDNCVKFLTGIKALAEDSNVTLCMELLNSKVNHPGYVCDSTKWGVETCKRVNSPRVKLLYDIYHMQIMEGDIVRTIQQNIAHIGHFHTAGNPGRHEFDDTQEMNYAGICKGIADLGYTGFISHEYGPTKDPIGTLDRMMKICEV